MRKFINAEIPPRQKRKKKGKECHERGFFLKEKNRVRNDGLFFVASERQTLQKQSKNIGGKTKEDRISWQTKKKIRKQSSKKTKTATRKQGIRKLVKNYNSRNIFDYFRLKLLRVIAGKK